MKKSILYSLFKIGSIPEHVLVSLNEEGIVLSDEGVSGWFIAKNVKGPGKRFLHRSEYFSGWLAITNKRVACYSFRKPQVNILVDDPGVASLQIGNPTKDILTISFESSNFRDEWKGIIELKYKTEKAHSFSRLLSDICAQQVVGRDR